MNEVTKIHLGRQAFTISVDAHHVLKSYLEAIRKQVGDKDVVDEIELRMAELLTEHGLNANKVILPGDVDFLKEQLGNPTDFKEDGDETDAPGPNHKSDSKRLFRDTDNAMIAGVAAGLAEYFGLDVLLVRILFVIATLITVGWGILLYIVLWLLVPETKTSSDRLLMAGKPVTIDGLKEVVERADVKGAARRVNATIAGPINRLFRIVLKVVGLLFILSGLSALFGLVAAETYILLHSGAWLQDNIFPIGLREHLLLDIAMAVVALFALFDILFGIAIFRRKWPIRTWITGMLIGLIFIGLAIGGALVADIYPNVRDRYNANVHTTVRFTQPFTAVNATGLNIDINYIPSDKYYVSLNYYDHPNLAAIKTTVNNGTLLIDTSQFNWQRNCQAICIPRGYNMIITVYSPDALQLINQAGNAVPAPLPPLSPKPMYQP
jgi:phage shock protein PspC (stress-responsive transcriptional regulator)